MKVAEKDKNIVIELKEKAPDFRTKVIDACVMAEQDPKRRAFAHITHCGKRFMFLVQIDDEGEKIISLFAEQELVKKEG